MRRIGFHHTNLENKRRLTQNQKQHHRSKNYPWLLSRSMNQTVSKINNQAEIHRAIRLLTGG